MTLFLMYSYHNNSCYDRGNSDTDGVFPQEAYSLLQASVCVHGGGVRGALAVQSLQQWYNSTLIIYQHNTLLHTYTLEDIYFRTFR